MANITTLKPDSPLAITLAKNRESFNTRFKAARLQNPALNPAEFSAHLSSLVARIIDSVAKFAPSQVDEVVLVIYELSLDLFAARSLGQDALFPEVYDAWESLLPKAHRFISSDPGPVTAAVSNAVVNVSKENPGAANRWIQMMEGLVDHCANTRDFLNAGQVVAWQCGLAHYRESALKIWKELSKPLQKATLGIDVTQDEISQMFLADPWFNPSVRIKTSALNIVSVAGGFKGFGGPFVTPPRVYRDGHMLMAADSESSWSIHADCFGTQFKRQGPPPSETQIHAPQSEAFFKNDRVEFRDEVLTHPDLKAWTSYASTEYTLAVTLKQSHIIYLIAMSFEN
ncbi:MAG: hypothetical protein ACC700_18785 [Anaerolineales bacterium]